MATATAWTRPPTPEAWSPVAAEGSSCTGRHCPAFAKLQLLRAAQGAGRRPGDRGQSRPAAVLPGRAPAARVGQLPAGAGRGPPPARHRPGAICQQHGFVPPAVAGQARQPGACALASCWRWKRLPTSTAQQRLAPSHGAAGPGSHGAVRRSPEKPRGALCAQPVPASPGRAAEALLPPPWRPSWRTARACWTFCAPSPRPCAGPSKKPRTKPRAWPHLYAQLGSVAPRLEAVFATTEQLLHTPPPGQALPPMVHPWKWMAKWIARRAHASPILPRQHAAPAFVEPGARRGADLGHADQLRQF